MRNVDHTHAADLTSWVDSANQDNADFPIQNLPYCVFRQGTASPRIGVGIGDQILDLHHAAQLGLLNDKQAAVASQESLNDLMALPLPERVALRHQISHWLSSANDADRSSLESCLRHGSDVELQLPCQIRDYTDFYASVFHATNVGSMFRPNNPLLPNYKHIPIGYHGRASSVVASGAEVRRPVGQQAPQEEGGQPTRAACKLLDYELEVGLLMGPGNELGQTIPIEQAEAHLFGLTLLNDWSARDLQKWEYQPLGPFLAKSFATTISPWVITLEALAPFRCPEFARPAGDPSPLDYLVSESNQNAGGVDLKLEVWLQSEQMRAEQLAPQRLSHGEFRHLYWTPAQMVTHHSSNGCNLQPGDLLGSGTVSGPERSSRGCLLELTWDGDLDHVVPGTQRTPLKLPTGEERTFLADGDCLTITGYCERDGQKRIGLGQCAGTILPAHAV